MKELIKHFPKLKTNQIDQFHEMIELYIDWNQKINVISRKDTENLFEKHILHSLALAKFKHFAKSLIVFIFKLLPTKYLGNARSLPESLSPIPINLLSNDE